MSYSLFQLGTFIPVDGSESILSIVWGLQIHTCEEVNSVNNEYQQYVFL